MSALRTIGQDDFAAGILRGPAPDVQPGVGVSSAVNGLYNDDGDVYRRGGTINTGMPALANPVQYVWSGYLAGIKRMMIGTYNSAYAVDPVTKARTLLANSQVDFTHAVQGAVTGELLFLPDSRVWGGATKPDNHAQQQVTTSAGWPDVVGVSTTFTTSLEIGTVMFIYGDGYYRVIAITDDTHATLDRSVKNSGTVTFVTDSLGYWDRPYKLDKTGRMHVAAIAGRLVAAVNNRIAFSEADNPWSFVADDFHELPGGVIVTGLAPLRDTLLVFTNYGLWTISNMAYDLTDALGNIQQNLSLIAPGVSLWGEGGLAEWAGRIVAPCLDRIYIVDAINPPQPISDSISPSYQKLLQTPGVQPGGAKAWRNHYFLPLLREKTGPSDQECISLQICRLDRPVQGRQLYFPWSTFEGHGGRMMAADINLLGATPTMLVAHQSGTLIDYGKTFDPEASVKNDADGSAHVFDVESRDFPTGNGQPNHVRKLRLRYSLDDTAQIQAAISFGTSGTDDSGFPPSPDNPARVWHKLDDVTPPSSGTEPVAWPLREGKRVRYVRARFRCTDAVSRLVFHHLDFTIRPASHDR